MTNLNKYKKKRKSYWLSVIFVIAFIAFGLFISEKKGITNLIKTKKAAPAPNQINQEAVNYIPTTQEEQKQTDDTKTSTTPTNNNSNGTTSNPSITITSAKQEGSNAVIQTKLIGANWSSCSLSLTQNSKTITKTAEAIFSREFSTCAGFSVPINELGDGSWTARLTAKKTDGASVSGSPINFNLTQ